MTGRDREEMGRRSRISRGEPTDGPDEMKMANAPDRALDDAVLRGDVARVPDDLVRVARLVAALRARVVVEAAPPISATLRAQLDAPNVVALRAARSARRALVLAAAVLAMVALIGIGAARNRLPGGIQDVVASTAEKLGIDVPRSSERDDPRSDEGLEHGRDGTSPNAPALVGAPGGDGATPGGATPALPGGPDGQATPAEPPAQVEAPEQAEKPKAPGTLEEDAPESPETPALTSSEAPGSPPGQGGAAPSGKPQAASDDGDGSASTPDDREQGSLDSGRVSGTTPSAEARAPGEQRPAAV